MNDLIEDIALAIDSARGERAEAMNDITEITNICGDLDTYADELDGEGWHNAANGCRYAKTEIEQLRTALFQIQRIGGYTAGIAGEALLGAPEQKGGKT